MENILSPMFEFLTLNWELSSVLAVITTIISYLAKKTSDARIKSKKSSGSDSFFKYANQLRKLPLDRKGYSDRIAYIMAELSNLAYYEFEKNDDLKKSTLIKRLTSPAKPIDDNIASSIIDDIVIEATSGIANKRTLEVILNKNHFDLLHTINKDSVQGFITKSNHPDPTQTTFIVVAFRGSEKEVNDWLTNANAKPNPISSDELVHSGFYKAFKSVEKEIRNCLKQHSGIPVYFTGHSLGGALALISSRMINPIENTGCYTFGAPRVGNYNFFFSLKTPVYRIVNSADIVPRVPPGIIITILFYWLFKGLYKLTKVKLFDSALGFIDKLKDYRHHGDQRYLTDVTDGKFDNTELLSNPSFEDQTLWFWKGILAGITYPVKSHSMYIYIEKLASIANKKL